MLTSTEPLVTEAGDVSVLNWAPDALRAVLGDVQLIEENGAVYADCYNAAERLLLAAGVQMGLVAGACKRTHLLEVRLA